MEHLSHLGNLSSRLRISHIGCYCYESLSTLEHSEDPPDFYAFERGERGWEIKPAGPSRLANNRKYEEIDTAAHFLQRWLYFEMLREFFRDVSAFHIKDFIVKDDNHEAKAITTKKLLNLLEQWREKSLETGPETVGRLLRIQDVLRSARSYTTKYCSVNEHDPGRKIAWSEENCEKITLGVMLLGEALSHALQQVQKGRNKNIPNLLRESVAASGWGSSSFVLKAFDEFCGNEATGKTNAIEHIRARCMNQSSALLYTLADYIRFDVDEVKGNPQPRHECSRDANCTSLGPDIKKVVDIIKKNGIPLFTYDSGLDKTKEVHVTEYNADSDEGYVVVSHVWRDGYGNVDKNELNRCVLDFFVKIFHVGVNLRSAHIPREDLSKGRPKSSEKKTIPFWIDTFGIPVGKAKDQEDCRRKAIGQMRSIYQNANATFVLDTGIMSVSWDDNWIRPAMRISLSNWVSRLWTLQEAVLSKVLFFVFRDSSVSIDRLEKLYYQKFKATQECILHVAHQYASRTLWDPSSYVNGAAATALGEKVVNAESVGNVWRALQWRRTTHLRHETLSLATLFGLSTTYFEDSFNKMDEQNPNPKQQPDLDGRMRRFLILLTESNACLPAGLLFLPGPHLPQIGFRWAPRSWLYNAAVGDADGYHMEGPGASLLNGIGVMVDLPGMLLHDLNKNLNDLARQEEDFYFTVDHHAHDWYHVEKITHGVWLQDPPNEISSVGSDVRLGLVFVKVPSSGEPERALLVKISKSDQRITRADILNRVYVSKVIDLGKVGEQQRAYRNGNSVSLCYGVHKNVSSWLLDGTSRQEDLGDGGIVAVPAEKANRNLAKYRNINNRMSPQWPRRSLPSPAKKRKFSRYDDQLISTDPDVRRIKRSTTTRF